MLIGRRGGVFFSFEVGASVFFNEAGEKGGKGYPGEWGGRGQGRKVVFVIEGH